MSHKHKFKIGDTVSVAGVQGNIFTLGYATNNTRKFTICPPGTEVPDENPLGYQINFGHKIKIIKESDIT